MSKYEFICYNKCSTCQKAKKYLLEHDIPFTERDIKTNNPTKEELKQFHSLSNLPLRKFFNTSGLVYKELKLKEKLPSMNEDEMLDILATNGMLVKRPLLVSKSKVIIGFDVAGYEKLNK